MKDLIAEFFQFFNPMAKLLFLLFLLSLSYPFRNAWKDQKLISKKKVELFHEYSPAKICAAVSVKLVLTFNVRIKLFEKCQL